MIREICKRCSVIINKNDIEECDNESYCVECYDIEINKDEIKCFCCGKISVYGKNVSGYWLGMCCEKEDEWFKIEEFNEKGWREYEERIKNEVLELREEVYKLV